jgi:hypothetical protein
MASARWEGVISAQGFVAFLLPGFKGKEIGFQGEIP